MQAEVSKANSVILIKDTSAVGIREQSQAPQVQANVSKANYVLLSQGRERCRREGATASAAGASRSEQIEPCIKCCMCKGETASITGANRSEQSNFFQICEQCRHKGATVCTTVIKVNLFSFLMMSLH